MLVSWLTFSCWYAFHSSSRAATESRSSGALLRSDSDAAVLLLLPLLLTLLLTLCCWLDLLGLLLRLSLVGLRRPVTSTRVLAVGDSRAAVVSGWDAEEVGAKEAAEDEKGEAVVEVEDALLMVEAMDEKGAASEGAC